MRDVPAECRLAGGVLYRGPVAASAVLYFTAAWCGPCRQLKPAVAALAEELARGTRPVEVWTVDVDAHGELADAYGVQQIPSFVVLRGGCATGACVRDVAALRRLLA